MAAEKTSDDLYDYETWATATKATLISKGLWDVVEKGVPSDPSKIPESAEKIQYEDLSEWRKLVRKDMEAIEILQSSLPDSVFKKTLSASSAKDVWDLLEKGNEESKLEKQLKQVSIDEEKESDCVEYLMFLENYGVFRYDCDMWMVCAKGTMNHMTSYHEFFTSLDCTHKGKVRLVDGNYFTVEGRGDVKFLMMGGKKKTIKNVLFVPRLDRNILSFQLLLARGYKLAAGSFRDRKGDVFGEYFCDSRGPALRLNVVEALTYDEDLWTASFHIKVHMSPYEKVFTTLDRRQNCLARMTNGTILMGEGKGDIKIVMNRGKEMTIANVLFIPDIKKNVLSLIELEKQGLTLGMGGRGKRVISDETGEELGETMWDGEQDGSDLALRLHLIKN